MTKIVRLLSASGLATAADDQGHLFAGFTGQGKIAVKKFVKK